MDRSFEYDAVLHEIPERGGAYVVFPWDIRKVFGRGQIKVHAEFDGEPYDGSIVNMGVRGPDGEILYIIGVLKSIRRKLGKGEGDSLHVIVSERPQPEADLPCGSSPTHASASSAHQRPQVHRRIYYRQAGWAVTKAPAKAVCRKSGSSGAHCGIRGR